ncbi:MAG: metallophosphoesterase family protein, partial [Prolixibacteraceae bacterium]
PYNDKSKLKPETIEWIKTIIEQAKDERKTILTFMHGAFLETFEGEATHFPEHLMENANEVANTLANLGLKVVFTGHNHIQDITEYISDEGNKITQVETGSLLAYPNPFRIIELKTNQQLSIKSRTFSQFYMGSEGANFESTSKSEFSKHYSVYINNILSSRFNVTGDLLTIGTNSATEVGCIHSKGDEVRPDDNSWIGIGMLKGNKGSVREAGVMLEKMDTDKFPPDNNFTLYLSGN